MRSMEAVMKDAGVLFDFLSDGGPGPDRADFVLAMGSQDLGVADTAARAFQEARKYSPAGWFAAAGWGRTQRRCSPSRRGSCMPGGAWPWGCRRTG